MYEARTEEFEDKSAPALVNFGFSEDEDRESDEEADVNGKVAEKSNFDVIAVGKALSEGEYKKRKPGKGGRKDSAVEHPLALGLDTNDANKETPKHAATGDGKGFGDRGMGDGHGGWPLIYDKTRNENSVNCQPRLKEENLYDGTHGRDRGSVDAGDFQTSGARKDGAEETTGLLHSG